MDGHHQQGSNDITYGIVDEHAQEQVSPYNIRQLVLLINAKLADTNLI